MSRLFSVDNPAGLVAGSDHGLLGGLSDDDHAIYALLAGRAGGQTLIGDTDANGDLILQSTANAARGDVIVDAAQLRAPSGVALVIARQDGTAWATLSTGVAATTLNFATNVAAGQNFLLLDNATLSFGASNDAQVDWGAGSQATAAALVVAVGVGSAEQGGLVLIVNLAHANQDFDHAAANNPTLIIHSAQDPDSGNDEFIEFAHDGTAARIRTGNALLTIGDSGFTVLALSTGTGGTDAFAITQRANTGGSPSALVVTGAAHTTLTASTEAIAVNLNLSATVQFATGALAAQRAVVVQAPTYAFVGASVITTAATFVITDEPQAGANATLTQSCALLVQAGNVGLFSATPTFGGGAEVMFIGDRTAAPGSNPSGGGILYSESGAGTWRGSGGTTTTFAFADPICDRCGRDFGWQWVNDGTVAGHTGGRLAICGWCLLTMLENQGIDVRECLIGSRS